MTLWTAIRHFVLAVVDFLLQ